MSTRITPRSAARATLGPLRLYWHVDKKNVLLQLALDQVLGEDRVRTRPQARLQESLRDWLVELRRVLRRHPWAAALAVASVERGPNMLRHWDRGATLLLDAGFDERQVFYGLSTLLTYAVGTGVQDAIGHSYEADDQTEIREETLSRRPSSSVPSTPPSTRPFNA